MARPREPINLLEAKGRKHLTKAEIEERRDQEVKARSDKIRALLYLTALFSSGSIIPETTLKGSYQQKRSRPCNDVFTPLQSMVSKKVSR